MVASAFLGAERPAAERAVWPVPVAECLLALDRERATGRRRAASQPPFTVIRRSASTLATDCGGGGRPKASCTAECLGLCLIEGSFLPPPRASGCRREGKAEVDSDEIWLVERHGDGYRVVSKAQLPVVARS